MCFAQFLIMCTHKTKLISKSKVENIVIHLNKGNTKVTLLSAKKK